MHIMFVSIGYRYNRKTEEKIKRESHQTPDLHDLGLLLSLCLIEKLKKNSQKKKKRTGETPTKNIHVQLRFSLFPFYSCSFTFSK